MKILLRSLLLALTFFAGASLATAMNNDDVIKMVKAELDEQTVILAVQAAKEPKFDTSADGVIQLKKAGVSQPVIQAMLKKQGGGDAAPAEAAPAVKRISSKKVPDDQVLPPTITPAAGQEYFTRYTMKFEGDEWLATNYWRGALLPINSKVQLVNLKKNSFTLKVVETGATFTVKNVDDYTKRSIGKIAGELLADQPTKIEKYGDEMADAIRTGTLRLGMTKTQVILARGYPPVHETPSLDGATWKFWSSRFVYLTLAFDGDILRDGRGLN